MPRRYRMGARAAAANDTAERIVHAARELHARQGISGTSYEEIAAEASTSTATVYRHFPSLAELLPACARSVAVLKEITRQDALLLFRGLDTPTERLDLLISGTCECYQRDGDWLNAARGEEQTYAVLAELARIQTSSLRLLVEAALDGLAIPPRVSQRIAALLDFPVWKALIAAGFSETEATDEVRQLIHAQLPAYGG